MADGKDENIPEGKFCLVMLESGETRPVAELVVFFLCCQFLYPCCILYFAFIINFTSFVFLFLLVVPGLR